MSIVRILRPATGIASAVADWSAARASSRVLGKLSQRELADIGYGPGDVDVSALIARR